MFRRSGIFFKDLIYLKKWDVIIVFIILVLAGSMYFLGFQKEYDGVAVIYVSGDKKETLSLLENREITIETENGYNTVQVRDGKIRVIDADCRDKICVNHAPVSFSNEMIVCLPHKLIVEVAGTEVSAIDIVAQ